MNKPDYITDNDWKLLNQKYKDIDSILKKLEKNYPVQYLIGDVDFYGYKIKVNENVLIPRFETEGLIELTIEYINKYLGKDISVLDIGTGSGCIPIVLKKELPYIDITSIDISDKALEVAMENAKLNKVDIDFKNISIFDYKSNNKYDVIISNPPYVALSEEIDPKVKYEPNIALYANHKGLGFYDYIIANAKDLLKDKFIMAFEIGCSQGKYLHTYAKKYFPTAKIFEKKDLSKRDRYLFIINV